MRTRQRRTSLGKSPAEQFKRATTIIRSHLMEAITAYLAPQVSTPPPDFWVWADAIAWQGYTPEDRAALTRMGYVINMAHRDTSTTPFSPSLPVQLGRDVFIIIRPTLPPPPDVVHVPVFSSANLSDIADRGPGRYTPTTTLGDYWTALGTQMRLHYSDRTKALDTPPIPPPPALLPWLAQLHAVDEQANHYYEAYDLVANTIWKNLPTGASFDSCNSCLLTVPEWVPSTILPTRRNPLPQVTRTRIEATMEILLQNHRSPELGYAHASNAVIPDADAPLLPQLRAFLLPALTAYRLAGGQP